MVRVCMGYPAGIKGLSLRSSIGVNTVIIRLYPAKPTKITA
jgi:hypothetical protein